MNIRLGTTHADGGHRDDDRRWIAGARGPWRGRGHRRAGSTRTATRSARTCATTCTPRNRSRTRPPRTRACNCVECHMGRTSTLHLMALKPTHVKELWGMIAGYERPTARQHAAPGARGLRELPLSAGRAPRQRRVQQALRNGPEEQRDRLPDHAAHQRRCRARHPVEGHGHPLAHRNDVEFKSPGPAGRSDPVGAGDTQADGTKVTYIDRESKLSAADIGKLEPRRMECYNCHNAVGHPFPNPARPRRRGDRGRQDRPQPSLGQGARRGADRRRRTRSPGRSRSATRRSTS